MDSSSIIRVIMAERDRTFAYIWSIVGDVHLAEDVLQEVTLLAIEKARPVADDLALIAWLRRASRFKSLEALRRTRGQPQVLDDRVLDQLEATWSNMDDSDPGDLVEHLRQCVGKLSPSAQHIVKLRYADSLKSREVSELLNRKVETVYQALTRIHKFLARCIEQQTQLNLRRTNG